MTAGENVLDFYIYGSICNNVTLVVKVLQVVSDTTALLPHFKLKTDYQLQETLNFNLFIVIPFGYIQQKVVEICSFFGM